MQDNINIIDVDSYEVEDTNDVETANDVDMSKIVNSDNISTEIAVIESSTSLGLTNAFDNVLRQIPIQLSVIDNLLEEYRTNPDEFFDKYDEDDIEAQIKTLRELNGFTRNVDSAKVQIRKYLEDRKKAILGYIDERLQEADFAKLKSAETDIRHLKNDLLAHRKEQRWNELKEIFEACFDTAEGKSVKEFLPGLTDFEKFRENNPDLVSGAKNKNITRNTTAYVRDTVNSYVQGLSLIQQNSWGLNNKYMAQLMKSYESNPDFMTLNQIGISLAAAQVAEAQREFERRQAEEEAKRKAEEQRKAEEERVRKLKEAENLSKMVKPTPAPIKKAAEQKKAEEQASPKSVVQEPPKPKNNFSQYILATHRQQFGTLLPYIETNPAYDKLHTDPNQKASLIWECMMSVTDQNSMFFTVLRGDPVKILAFVRFVLDI